MDITKEEAIAARKEILDAFFNISYMFRLFRIWVFKERSLFLMYIKMSVRHKIA